MFKIIEINISVEICLYNMVLLYSTYFVSVFTQKTDKLCKNRTEKDESGT